MRLRTLLCPLLLLAVPVFAQAQSLKLKGRFEDSGTRAPVAGVAVKLTAFGDTADVRRTAAKDDGSFEFTGLAQRSYRLEATRLGYAPMRMVVRVSKQKQDAGAIALTTESVRVPGVTITESPAPATQKADTTEFRAGAVKVHKDATAEELVQKLPGVTVENGQVKAQGENVQQVLVNGRPFFGSDPTAALRNLPADVVDRIQVYDRASDQAEFSGFDDGQSQRTMNFVLRDQKAQFGKVYAGYGDQDRYQAGGNATLVRGPSRVTAIGMSNNVNQKNFSPQDLFGALGSGGGTGGAMPRIMMMGGGGGHRPPGGGGMQIIRAGGGGFGGGAFDPGSFFVGQQSGVSTTHSGGFNAVTQVGKRLQLSGSLFANDTDTDNRQTLGRQYLPPQDSLALYDQFTTSDSRSGNQRFDARLEWTPDSLNSVIVQPRLYFQQSDAASVSDAANRTLAGRTLGASNGRSGETIDGDNLSTRMTLRHRFGKRGRNVSADLNVGRTSRDSRASQLSFTDTFAGPTTASDTLDQRTNGTSATNSFSSRVAFTEPVTKSLQAQLVWNPSLSWSESDARAFTFDPRTGAYTRPDSALSNVYETRNVVQTAGLAMLWTTGPWKLLANASGEQRRLRSERTFPIERVTERTFESFLPSATLTGNFANRRSLRLAWNTSTQAPSVSQLQDVVNNSNPLALSTGNPDLRPTASQTVSLRWSETEPLASKSRFVFGNVTRTRHPIGNATFTAPHDTTIHGVALAPGTQLTRPENLDESWNANLFGVLSRPTGWMKSILSVNGGGTFTRTPSRVNGFENVADAWVIRSGVTLASNISQNLDFTVSYQGTWNVSRNTLTTSDRADYYSHALGLRLNTTVAHGFVFRQELNHNLQSRVPTPFGQDVVLWNTTVGKKFLKGERGEIRLTATDVFQQNRSVSRSVTETYVQDSRDMALSRYVQAVFTYSFR